MRDRRRVARPCDPTHGRRPDPGIERGYVHLFGPRMDHGNVPGHALLQQELGGLYHRFAVEPGAHLATVERVCDGHDGHPLVMGHEAAHERK